LNFGTDVDAPVERTREPDPVFLDGGDGGFKRPDHAVPDKAPGVRDGVAGLFQPGEQPVPQVVAQLQDGVHDNRPRVGEKVLEFEPRLFQRQKAGQPYDFQCRQSHFRGPCEVAGGERQFDGFPRLADHGLDRGKGRREITGQPPGGVCANSPCIGKPEHGGNRNQQRRDKQSGQRHRRPRRQRHDFHADEDCF